jgi:hypothetical protein
MTTGIAMTSFGQHIKIVGTTVVNTIANFLMFVKFFDDFLTENKRAQRRNVVGVPVKVLTFPGWDSCDLGFF